MKVFYSYSDEPGVTRKLHKIIQIITLNDTLLLKDSTCNTYTIDLSKIFFIDIEPRE